MESLRSRLSRVRRQTWVRWGVVVGGVSLVLLVWWVAGPRPEVVSARLAEQYGVDEVRWGPNARFQPEVLVVDGRDISDECTVKGAWGSLDDLEIVCARDVGIGRVEQP